MKLKRLPAWSIGLLGVVPGALLFHWIGPLPQTPDWLVFVLDCLFVIASGYALWSFGNDRSARAKRKAEAIRRDADG